MKIVGTVMVILSLSFLGLYISSKTLSVLNDINRVDSFFKSMLIGLRNEHLTVYEILESAAAESDNKTKIFIKNIDPQKIQASSKIASECGFCSNIIVLNILYDVLSVFGKYPAAEQINEIESYRQKLQNYYESIEKDVKNKSKIIRISGVLFGFAVAIMLI